MKTLYLRIYVTVVAVLLLFAVVSGWVFQRNIEHERAQGQQAWIERLAGWTELAQRSLPPASAPQAAQRDALIEMAVRLRVPMALDDAGGRRVAASESFARREAEVRQAPGGGPLPRIIALPLADGRTLWVLRGGLMRSISAMGASGPDGLPLLPPRFGDGGRSGGNGGGAFAPPFASIAPPDPPWLLRSGPGLVLTLLALFVAVAAGAYPVVRRLTRRLEALQQGVEAFGAGALHQRVAEGGNDEVAAVATSFNRAASRVEALVRSHQSLLANASHELRSPLARMKMAVAMLDDATGAQRQRLRREIDTNVAELDALVEEVLLASRLDAGQRGDTRAGPHADPREPVDLLALAAEEGARVGALVDGQALTVTGDERLLRRALRNLLENARRYGGGEIVVTVAAVTAAAAAAGAAGAATAQAQIGVCDRGPGVPEALRERIFEAFYRLPGHAEQAGGVGLGLSLVRQIAERHAGSVRCEARDGGGSCFVLTLPAG